MWLATYTDCCGATSEAFYLAVNSVGSSPTPVNAYHRRLFESRRWQLGWHRKRVEACHHTGRITSVGVRRQVIIVEKFRRVCLETRLTSSGRLKRCASQIPRVIGVVDKGYDKQSEFEYAEVVLGAWALIVAQAVNRHGIRLREKRRRRQATFFD